MRQQTAEQVISGNTVRDTLSYPDAVCMVFNPCVISTSGQYVSKMGVYIENRDTELGNSKHQSITVEAFNGVCHADIREFLQSFFKTETFGDVNYREVTRTGLGLNVSVNVTLYHNDGSTVLFNFTLFCIWGCTKTGGQERYNSYRDVYWFRGYPFTLGVFADSSGTVLLEDERKTSKVIPITGQGVWNIPLTEANTAKRHYNVKELSGGLSPSTFDNTFDVTFRYHKATSTDRLKIHVVDCNMSGMYLRWIDRQGFYCYYLFKKGEEQVKVSSEDMFYRHDIESYNLAEHRGLYGRNIIGRREEIVSVCAPLVNSGTFDMLLDLKGSPCVDLFIGYDEEGKDRWLPIGVVQGNHTKSGAVLQDFVVQIAMPEVAIQRL